jgi:hypothetical protein
VATLHSHLPLLSLQFCFHATRQIPKLPHGEDTAGTTFSLSPSHMHVRTHTSWLTIVSQEASPKTTQCPIWGSQWQWCKLGVLACCAAFNNARPLKNSHFNPPKHRRLFRSQHGITSQKNSLFTTPQNNANFHSALNSLSFTNESQTPAGSPPTNT